MDDETVLERKSNLLQLLSNALELADGLAELDVAIRISEAIDILEIPE
jgi:hypothetical protein